MTKAFGMQLHYHNVDYIIDNYIPSFASYYFYASGGKFKHCDMAFVIGRYRKACPESIFSHIAIFARKMRHIVPQCSWSAKTGSPTYY